MIGKLNKGKSFGGLISYTTGKKEAKIIDSKGVNLINRAEMSKSFELQTMLSPHITRPVGHISLSFSAEDSPKLDDNQMVTIAREYMARMGIHSTQYMIVRHSDRRHPHCHIIYNRVDDAGRTISDKNERYRNAKICSDLTKEYHLHKAKGKDRVNRDRLKGFDITKYRMYDAVRIALLHCRSWEELKADLERERISFELIRNGASAQIQGIVFYADGISMNGSKIDRTMSFSKISKALHSNEISALREESHQVRHAGYDSEIQREREAIRVNVTSAATGAVSIRGQAVQPENTNIGSVASELTDMATDAARTYASVIVSMVTMPEDQDNALSGGGTQTPEDLSEEAEKRRRRHR